MKVTTTNHQLQALLGEIQSRLGNLQPAMETIGARLESLASAGFETETDPQGKPWAPWAQSTRDTYPADGNGRILDRSGHMLSPASLSWQADRSSATVGFGAVYAVYHEWGTVTMPRRGVLLADPDAGLLSTNQVAEIEAVLADYFGAIST